MILNGCILNPQTGHSHLSSPPVFTTLPLGQVTVHTGGPAGTLTEACCSEAGSKEDMNKQDVADKYVMKMGGGMPNRARAGGDRRSGLGWALTGKQQLAGRKWLPGHQESSPLLTGDFSPLEVGDQL